MDTMDDPWESLEVFEYSMEAYFDMFVFSYCVGLIGTTLENFGFNQR